MKYTLLRTSLPFPNVTEQPVCKSSCLDVISLSQALPQWKGHSGSHRQLPAPGRMAHLAFTRMAKRAAMQTNMYRTLPEVSTAFLLSCEKIFSISYCNTRAGWKRSQLIGSHCALPSFWKDFLHTKFLPGTLLLIHCTEPRAFNCCYEEHQFYVKPHTSKLTFDIISCRLYNSPCYISCQNIFSQVHLT